MKKLMSVIAAIAVLVVLPEVARAEVSPPSGSEVSLHQGEIVNLHFPCEFGGGGVQVFVQPEGFSEWRSQPATFEPGDECNSVLFPIPSWSGPHVYWWRTVQCLYSGTCAIGPTSARVSPIYAVTINLESFLTPVLTPVPVLPPIERQPPGAAANGPPSASSPSPIAAECARALRTARNLKGRAIAARRKFEEATTLRQRRTWNRISWKRLRNYKRAVTHAEAVCPP